MIQQQQKNVPFQNFVYCPQCEFVQESAFFIIENKIITYCKNCNIQLHDPETIPFVYNQVMGGSLCKNNKLTHTEPSPTNNKLVIQFPNCGCTICLDKCWSAYCINNQQSILKNGKIVCANHCVSEIDCPRLIQFVKFYDIYRERANQNALNNIPGIHFCSICNIHFKAAGEWQCPRCGNFCTS
jgi:hypothetical protein